MARIVRWLAVVSLAVLPLLPGTAQAAPKAPVGISITPFLQQIQIEPGDIAKSFNVTVGNQTESIQEITLSGRDFGSLNDTGGLILEGSKGGYSQKYGLASWLTVGQDTVVLQPHESKTLDATIENRTSLQPGGHYGAIVATIGNPDQQATDKVVINQQLMALVLVTKVGGEHYDLRLKRIEQNGNWLHLPNTVKLRFQNPGNVHVVPRGLVELKSPNGTVLSRGVVNDESAIILPETFREIPVTMTPVDKALPLPGIYRLVVTYRYDGFSYSATKTVWLRFINAGMYAVILLVLVVGLWLYAKRAKWLPIVHKKSSQK